MTFSLHNHYIDLAEIILSILQDISLIILHSSFLILNS